MISMLWCPCNLLTTYPISFDLISLLFWFPFIKAKYLLMFLWPFIPQKSEKREEEMSIEEVRSAGGKGWGISVSFDGGSFPFTPSNYKTSWIEMTNKDKNSRRQIQQETVGRFTLQTLCLTKGLLLCSKIVGFFRSVTLPHRFVQEKQAEHSNNI